MGSLLGRRRFRSSRRPEIDTIHGSIECTTDSRTSAGMELRHARHHQVDAGTALSTWPSATAPERQEWRRNDKDIGPERHRPTGHDPAAADRALKPDRIESDRIGQAHCAIRACRAHAICIRITAFLTARRHARTTCRRQDAPASPLLSDAPRPIVSWRQDAARTGAA